MPSQPRHPRYRLHKASGRAVVTLNGVDVYLGKHGTTESKERYDRAIAEWLATGRQAIPGRKSTGEPTCSIAELIAAYIEHAEQRHRRRDGKPSTHLPNIKQALRVLRRLYESQQTADFNSAKLIAVRQKMIAEKQWSRNTINSRISRIRAVFKWGATMELVPWTVYHLLSLVEDLPAGCGEAEDYPEVQPVRWEQVEAIKPFVSRQVWAMITLQWQMAARPGELVNLRIRDINVKGDVWTADLREHKTSRFGKRRTLPFGPKAQEILKSFLQNRPLDAFIFSPAEAERERREQRSQLRKTPLSCGNRPGTNRSEEPERPPRDHYDVASYRRAITRACELAFPLPANLARQRIKITGATRWETNQEWKARLGPDWAEVERWQEDHHWHPNQLRHSAATWMQEQHGVENAQILLGHRLGSKTVDIYAQAAKAKLMDIMKRVG